MPFNQQLSFPVELTLRTTEDGVRLYRRPVREIELLRGKSMSWKDRSLEPGPDYRQLFRIRPELDR